jgi:hypothetical protein
MSILSAAPTAPLPRRWGRTDGRLGWWRNGVIYQCLPIEPGVVGFVRDDGFACLVNCSTRAVCAPLGSQLLLGSDPDVGEKLPPDSAGWFLLEATP